MQKSKVFLPGFVLAIATATPVFADGGSPYYGHGMMGGGWFFGPIMMLLFFSLFVGAIILTARFFGVDSSNRSSSNSLDILKDRFAKGEIEKEEFEERKRILGS